MFWKAPEWNTKYKARSPLQLCFNECCLDWTWQHFVTEIWHVDVLLPGFSIIIIATLVLVTGVSLDQQGLPSYDNKCSVLKGFRFLASLDSMTFFAVWIPKDCCVFMYLLTTFLRAKNTGWLYLSSSPSKSVDIHIYSNACDANASNAYKQNLAC